LPGRDKVESVDAMEIILGDYDLAFMGFVMEGNFSYYYMLFDMERTRYRLLRRA